MPIRPRTAVAIGAAAVVVVAAGVTIGVNASSRGGDASGTVTWWVPDWDLPVAQQLVDQFEADNSDLTVDIVQVTGDTIVNKVTVALESGNAPDVITESIARTPGYIDDGELTDLSDIYGDDLPQDDFVPGVLDSVSKDGKIYAVPYRWATNALIYNPDLFEQAGITEPPTTFDEFVDAEKKLQAIGVDGTAWPMKGDPSDLTLRFLDFATSNGSTIEDGTPHLTQDSVEKALELIGSSVADGYASASSFELDNTGIRELFLQGRVGMYLGGVFDVDTAEQQGKPVASAMAPGPDGVGSQEAVGWAHLVPADAKNVDGAKRFVTFLGQADSEAALTLTFPARISAGQDPKFQTETRKAFYDQLVDHSIPAANDPRWIEMIPSVYDVIQSVALGDVTPADGAAQIMSQAQTSLG